MSLCVEAVQSKRDRHDFVELAWKIYRDDPRWVPPIRADLHRLLGWRHHAFYQHAESQAFVARRDGEVVGRIAAIVNHAHVEIHREPVGFFGFFETIDDVDVAGALLDAARQWLRQRNMERIRGPVSPSLHHECGLLVTAFDAEPYFMTPYNPPYYMHLLKKLGCRKAKDLLAYVFFAEEVPRILSLYQKQWDPHGESSGITIRHTTRKLFDHDLHAFLKLYNESLEGLWGTVPMTGPEIDDLVGAFRWLVSPELVTLAEQDGTIVGAMVALLDFNPLLRDIGGRLFPLGFLHLLRGQKNIKRARLLAMHVADEFLVSGLGGALFASLLPAFQKWRFEEFEVSWTLEDNQMARRSLERAGGQLYKRFRIYEYD
jgi:hypothetical protein